MMKQKDAVFAAMTAGSEQGLTGDDQINFAVEQVKTGLMSGEIVHSKGPFTDEKAARSYAGSLVSNWKKKDVRLTGGVKYTPETKRGPIVKDETLKKLNDSLKSLRINQPNNSDLIGRVEAAIEERRSQLAAAKAQTKVQTLDETLAALQELGIEVA
jgi:hypothetical protein